MASKSKSKSKTEPKGPFSSLRDLRDKMAKESEDKKLAGKPEAAPAKRAASKPRAASARDAEGESDLDFHRLMAGVTPLDARGGRRLPKTDVSPAARTRADRAGDDDGAMEHLRVLVTEGSKFEVVDDGRRVEGRRGDVPPDFLRRLRRGGYPIDARLDLHGLTASEAAGALAAFLSEKRAKGERCVLVIHGKGAHSPGGEGVLRGEISAWLSQGKGSVHVAAFATALEDDGGEGATYVLLRR